jgi:hypothetical protein
MGSPFFVEHLIIGSTSDLSKLDGCSGLSKTLNSMQQNQKVFAGKSISMVC